MKSPTTVLFFVGCLSFCFANDFPCFGLLGVVCFGLLALWVIAVGGEPASGRRSRSDDDDYFYAQGDDDYGDDSGGGDGDGF